MSDRGQEKSAEKAPVAKRVLVVDDSEGSREMVREILQAEGFQVVVAESGKEALECIQTQIPDVGVIDIGLQDISGYVLAKKIGDMQAGIRLVAVSGFVIDGGGDRAGASGFEAFLEKPVNVEALLRFLNQPQ